MTPDRLQEILEAYGADPHRWPPGERDEAAALLATTPALREAAGEAERLDRLLDRLPLPDAPPLDTALLTARVTAQSQQVPQYGTVVTLFRTLGLRGPAVAGLALAAGIAGFVVGWDMPTDYPAGDEFAGLLPASIMEVDTSW